MWTINNKIQESSNIEICQYHYLPIFKVKFVIHIYLFYLYILSVDNF